MSHIETRLLQIAVAVGSLVPMVAGVGGMLLGPGMLESPGIGSVDLDSHFRYLSGLLLAIGIGYSSTVLHIETQGPRLPGRVPTHRSLAHHQGWTGYRLHRGSDGPMSDAELVPLRS